MKVQAFSFQEAQQEASAGTRGEDAYSVGDDGKVSQPRCICPASVLLLLVPSRGGRGVEGDPARLRDELCAA